MPLVIVIASVLSAAALMFIIYAVALMPNVNRKSEMLHFQNYRYAHRGLHGENAPENSLSAFKRAADEGYGIELDVRLSRDGELVVFHDDSLERMTGVCGNVNEYSKDELVNMKLLNSGEGIPTLDEVLSLVDGRVPLLIEIKEAKGSLDVTKSLCERLKSYTGEYIIESFNPFAIKEVRKKLPSAIVGILSEHFTASNNMRTGTFYLLQSMFLNILSRPDFVAYNHRHTKFLPFRLARSFGCVCLAYTVKSEQEEARALESSFDGVIFEGYTPASPYINGRRT